MTVSYSLCTDFAKWMTMTQQTAVTALQMEETSDVRPKRTRHLTEKALELKLHNLMKDRR